MPLLSDIEIQRGLGTLTGWARKGSEIAKTYTFAGFPDAIAFVQRVVPIAEAMNHHPDLDVRYNRVTVRLSTHDKGGITDRDLEQARQLDQIEPGHG